MLINLRLCGIHLLLALRFRFFLAERSLLRSDVKPEFHGYYKNDEYETEFFNELFAVINITANCGIQKHDLRHTYASHYIMNGVSLTELQALLGHSNTLMTLKYAHLTPGFLEKKAGVVSFSIPKENLIPLRRIK